MQNEVEPTLGLGLKLWWASFWRIMPLVLIGSFVVGFIIGILGLILGVDNKALNIVAGIAGGVFGIYVSAFIFRRLMVKGFGRYRLAVVEK